MAFSPNETENGLLTAREVAQNRGLPADLVVLRPFPGKNIPPFIDGSSYAALVLPF